MFTALPFTGKSNDSSFIILRRRCFIAGLISRTGAQALREQTVEANGSTLAHKIAEDFTKFLETFHSYREPYDDALDAWLHESYAKAKRKRQYFDFRSQPYFSPSSANSDKRELYEKMVGAKRDEQDVKPWQRRWTALGTQVGDWIQREILLAERHYGKFTGKAPYFTMARTDEGYPFFEDFVKTMKVIEHNGKRFSLFGTCDGVMEYVTDDGETLRVGLEIKSKQTTAAQTSDYSMREPKEDHVKQVTCYSIMYDVDYYVILYVNTSKKAWNMSDEEYAKSPDFKAFGIAITDEMKRDVLDTFAEVVALAEIGSPPPLDLDKFTFNNFKTACALSLSDDEFNEIKTKVQAVKRSRLPDWKKRSYIEALEFIEAVRND